MITSFMTDEEICNEARLDFLEIKEKIRIAFSEFHKTQSQTNGKRSFMHSVVQTKTYRTKRHNVWNVRFRDCGHIPNGDILVLFLTYTTIIHRDGRVDYLFMNDLDRFCPEKLTAHFLQRYKERYLIPNNIDLRGMPVAVYFLVNNQDKKPTYYIPKSWTEKDVENRNFWISDQGLFVSECTNGFMSFITFLDQKNLSRYQAEVYEEEHLFRAFFNIDVKNLSIREKQACFNQVYRIPNAKIIYERCIRRMLKTQLVEDYEEQVQILMGFWNRIMESTENIGQLSSKRDKLQRIENRSLYLNKDFLKLFQ